MIIVLDISPSDRTIYLTEPTIEVLISFFTLPATASRSIFYLYRIRIPFHPKHQPFTLKGSHFLLHNFLLDDLTYQYLKSYWRHLRLYLSYFIDVQSLLFFFCFQPCNPLNKWPFTIPVPDSRLIPNSYCTVHMYKLSPATNASLELFIGAAQNLATLCCLFTRATEISWKPGLLRFSLKPCT